MSKTILLIFFLTLIQYSYCFNRNLSAEASHTVKEMLTKWEKKELELSTGCAQQLYQLLENMLSFDDGFWAYKMIDATGKFPSGLAEGNVAVMGSFDECLEIKSEKKNVKGNYCTITVDISGIDFLNFGQMSSMLQARYEKLTKNHGANVGGQPVGTLPVLGVCLPDKCTPNDITNGLHLLTTILPLDIRCQTKDDIIPPLDTGAIATISVFGVVIVLMTLSTTYDVICQRNGTKPKIPLIAFSAYTNGQKLFRISKGQGELGCLHGIRFLSMCWVILAHIFIANVLGPTVNLFDMLNYLSKTECLLFLNAAHAVDTFFVISGLLVSYNFLKKMKKGEKFNIIQYYVHRYLRLTPAYAVVILTSMYLLNYLGSGPLYYKVDTVVGQLCRDHWWKALLYLQNYLTDAANICVSQSWNLNIDWQLYLISPVLLFFFYKTPKFGTLMTIVSIIGFMSAGFIITYQKNLTTVLLQGDTTRLMTYYYLKTHTRAATWFMGAWLGYILGRIKFYNDKTYLRLPRFLPLILWIVALIVMPVCVVGGHDMRHNMLTKDTYDRIGSSFYNTFARPAWALCVSWIIFACTNGYGGIINSFLSLPIFSLFSKFTYSMYLLHLTILYMMVLSRKIPAYFSIPGLLNQYCTLFTITFFLSIFWILAFETPMLVIEPYIFGNPGKSSKKETEAASRKRTEVHIVLEVPENATSNVENIKNTQ